MVPETAAPSQAPLALPGLGAVLLIFPTPSPKPECTSADFLPAQPAKASALAAMANVLQNDF